MPTAKTFSKGSSFPVLEDGKLRLYSMRFCPYAERTRLVLNYLNVAHETVNINLKEKPEWFLEKNPLGTVPVVEHGKQIVCDSLICNEYLDELYGKNKLLTIDPYARARQKMLIERFSKVTVAYYRPLLETLTEEECLNCVEKAQNGLEVFEQSLEGRFFGGAEPSMVDLCIWPWFERFPMFQHQMGMDILPKEKFPKLSAWVSTMLDVPTVKNTLVSTEWHVEFIKTRTKERPLYDFGLN